MFKFPYTNLHELNLDWILEKVKHFAELIPPMETAVEDVQSLQSDVEQAVEDANQALEDAGQALETAEEAKEIAEQASQGTIADGAVTTDKLDDGAVTTAKIADGAVTGAKIASGTIQSGNLSSGCVTTTQILDGTISPDDLGTECVTTSKLGTSAVTTSKINDGAVNSSKLANNSVETAKILDGAVTDVKLGEDVYKVNYNLNKDNRVASLNAMALAFITGSGNYLDIVLPIIIPSEKNVISVGFSGAFYHSGGQINVSPSNISYSFHEASLNATFFEMRWATTQTPNLFGMFKGSVDITVG